MSNKMSLKQRGEMVDDGQQIIPFPHQILSNKYLFLYLYYVSTSMNVENMDLGSFTQQKEKCTPIFSGCYTLPTTLKKIKTQTVTQLYIKIGSAYKTDAINIQLLLLRCEKCILSLRNKITPLISVLCGLSPIIGLKLLHRSAPSCPVGSPRRFFIHSNL